MVRFIFIVFVGFLGFFLVSCSISENQSVATIERQIDKFHRVIEDTTSKRFVNQEYQSLAYNELKVFKPTSFVRLDSVYRIKQAYLDNNDLRGLRLSGIEDLIPGYRAEAQQEIHEVRYEIEHLYQVSALSSDSLNMLEIHHDFFLFDHKDSLISITPLYDFQIRASDKDLFYAYQFGYHFVDDRNLYISKAEQDFLWFFRNRETALAGEESLSDFMQHTLGLMKLARKYGTVDFRELGKAIVIDYFSETGKEIYIEKIHPLLSLTEGDTNVGYTLKVVWMKNDVKEMTETIFHFSPYLELKKTENRKIENRKIGEEQEQAE